MEKKIQKLKDHYIICGHGRMGQTVRERLEAENLPSVDIESGDTLLVLGDNADINLFEQTYIGEDL
jgi:voltage-gated potassium channel